MAVTSTTYYLREQTLALGVDDPETSDVSNWVDWAPINGKAYWRGGRFINDRAGALAMEDSTKIIELYPRYPLGYLGRGRVYLSQERYEEAIEDFHCVISLSPLFSQAFLFRGLAFIENRSYKQRDFRFRHVFDNGLERFQGALL